MSPVDSHRHGSVDAKAKSRKDDHGKENAMSSSQEEKSKEIIKRLSLYWPVVHAQYS